MMESPSKDAPPKRVSPRAVHDFLCKCARTPDRFYYPCNAKARQPVSCIYQLNVPGRSTVSMLVHECEYVEGGTGWRVWPCALLLSCWLAAHEAEISIRHSCALELGCGLGLPGLTAAALGAARVALTDCLPRLLRTVADSCTSCREHEPRGTTAHAALLDWEDEAAAAGGPRRDAAEQYSTEQGVKENQLLAEVGKTSMPRLAEDQSFELLLARCVPA